MKLLRYFGKKILKYEEFELKNKIKLKKKKDTYDYMDNYENQKNNKNIIDSVKNNENYIKNKISKYIKLGLKDDIIKKKILKHIDQIKEIDNKQSEKIIKNFKESSKNINDNSNDLENDIFNKKDFNIIQDEIEHKNKIENIIKDIPQNIKDKLIIKTKNSVNNLKIKDPKLNSLIKNYEEKLKKAEDLKLSKQAEYYKEELSKQILPEKEFAINQNLKSIEANEFKEIMKKENYALSSEEYEILSQEKDLSKNKIFKIESEAGLTLKEKTQLEVKRISEELNLPINIVKDYMKEYVFFLKKKEEEELALKKRKEYKDKKDKIKNLVKEINETNLIDDTFEHDELFVDKKKLTQDSFFDLNKNLDSDKINKLKNEKTSHDFRITKYKKIYKKIIQDILFNEFKDLPENMIIFIEDMILNDSKSTINVFWKLNYLSLNNKQNLEFRYMKLIEKINIKLNKMEKYIQSKIFKEMSLKYPPNIRFFYSKIDELVTEMRNNMSGDLKHFIGEHLNKKQIEKLNGILDENSKKIEEEKMLNEKFNELLVVFRENVDNKNYLNKTNIKKVLIESGKIKVDENENLKKKIKKEKKEKKKKKKNKADEFWDSLEE